MTSRMEQRRDTAANWVTNNPTLAAGEIGLETDTAKFKMGDAVATWNNLVYSNPGFFQSTPTFVASVYTLVASDAGNFLFADNGSSAGIISIPTNATVPFPLNTQIYIQQTNSGQITIQAANSGTTTVNSTGITPTAPAIRAQWASCVLIKTGTDTWTVVGDIQ